MANHNSFQPEFFDVPDSQPNEMQNFINMTTKYMGDKSRSEEANQSQLMQSMANNNRLHASQQGDPGSFQYGGQWLKIGPKAETGSDRLNAVKADNYTQDQILSQANKAYTEVFKARLDEGAASRAYNAVLRQGATAYGYDLNSLTPMEGGARTKKERPADMSVGRYNPLRALPWISYLDPNKYEADPNAITKEVSNPFGGDTPADVIAQQATTKPVTKESMKTKQAPTPTAKTQPQPVAVGKSQTAQQTTPSGTPLTQKYSAPKEMPAPEDVTPRVASIKKVAPQNPNVDVAGLVRSIRKHVKSGVSKEMIIRDLGGHVTNAEQFYNEAVR